ncbi:MAG: hypothetical protein ACRDZ2_16230 [Ilumatobacteraceae bacterium]
MRGAQQRANAVCLSSCEGRDDTHSTPTGRGASRTAQASQHEVGTVPTQQQRSDDTNSDTERHHDMNIDKSQILELLRGQGDQDKADQAERELPDQVDTDRDSGLLDKLGLNIGDLLKKFGGGGGLGKLLG